MSLIIKLHETTYAPMDSISDLCHNTEKYECGIAARPWLENGCRELSYLSWVQGQIETTFFRK